MSSRIIIDATSFLTFLRSGTHFSGIQRTLFEYSQRFSQSGLFDIEYIEFIDGMPLSVDMDYEIKEYFQTLLTKNRITKLANTSNDINISRRIYAYLPTLLKKILKKIYSTLKKTPDNSIKKTKKVMFFEFLKDDRMLLLDAFWDTEEHASAIVRAIDSNDLKLIFFVYDLLPFFADFTVPSVKSDHSKETYMKMLSRASSIVTYSDNNITEITQVYGMNNMQLPQIYKIALGSDFETKNYHVDDLPPMEVGESFVLTVGSLVYRKNYLMLYYAYKYAEEVGIELPQLVIVGASNPDSDPLLLLLLEKDMSIKGKIVHLSNVDDNTLNILYNKCLFVLMPSLYEGWGLGITESLEHNRFCIASNTSSLPEVGQGLVENISAYDSALWAKRINYYYTNPDKLEIAKEKIMQNFERTSWDDSFNQLVKTLHAIMGSKNV